MSGEPHLKQPQGFFQKGSKKVAQLLDGSSCWQWWTNQDNWIGLPRPEDGQMTQFLRMAVIQGLEFTVKWTAASLSQGSKLTTAKIRLNRNTGVMRQEVSE